jgi:hypothetical protein
VPISIKLVVSVCSVDPAVSTAKLAGEIERMQADLFSGIQNLGADTIEISRDLNFPVPGSEIALEILIGVASGIGEAVGKTIGDHVINWLRSRWPNSDIELIQLHLSDHSERTE